MALYESAFGPIVRRRDDAAMPGVMDSWAAGAGPLGYWLSTPLRIERSRYAELELVRETLATQATEYDRWATVSDTNGDG